MLVLSSSIFRLVLQKLSEFSAGLSSSYFSGSFVLVGDALKFWLFVVLRYKA
jgi:hypothetical protein